MKVKLYEVGPRDGLQNEKQEIPVAVKVELINRLSETGLKFIEAGSFVSPKWVPQMAGTAEVMAGIRRKPGVVYPVLVPNEKGLEGARESKAQQVAIFTAASESFAQKNINCSIKESLERFAPVMNAGLPVRGYISCALGCPYEGDITPQAVADVAAKLNEMGCYEIVVSDTIGVGTPNKTRAMLKAVFAHVPVSKVALHCHDTYGQAIANIHAALEMGVATIDASVAGLGGCPYAKGASGNVATEDVLYLLNGLGIEADVDIEKLVDAAWFISEKLGRKPMSKVANAMRN